LCIFIRKAIKQITVIIEAYHFRQQQRISPTILLSRLTPYTEEVIGDCQCGFRRNGLTIDHIFCIPLNSEKNGN